MFCSSCGAKMSAKDDKCPSCGESSAGAFNLKISRPGKIMGCAVKLHVTVDDIEFDLSANDEKVLTLSKGVHTVKYNIWCRREHSVDVTIEDGKVCHVIFSYDALWGGFKVSKKSTL